MCKFLTFTQQAEWSQHIQHHEIFTGIVFPSVHVFSTATYFFIAFSIICATRYHKKQEQGIASLILFELLHNCLHGLKENSQLMQIIILSRNNSLSIAVKQEEIYACCIAQKNSSWITKWFWRNVKILNISASLTQQEVAVLTGFWGTCFYWGSSSNRPASIHMWSSHSFSNSQGLGWWSVCLFTFLIQTVVHSTLDSTDWMGNQFVCYSKKSIACYLKAGHHYYSYRTLFTTYEDKLWNGKISEK